MKSYNPYRVILIEKLNGEWITESCYSAATGFQRIGHTVIGLNKLEILNEANSPDIVVHGSIPTIQAVFKKLHIQIPEVHHTHIHLPGYTFREMGEITIGDILNREFNYFVKPLYEYKSFTAVNANSFSGKKILEKQSMDMKLVYSEIIDIISEYRCFVLNKKLIGCKNYTGDFKILPDFELINSAINDYIQQPVAYALDFAITKDYKTVLLEINDSYGLGTYGFNNILYCKMILSRWDEIIKKPLDIDGNFTYIIYRKKEII